MRVVPVGVKEVTEKLLRRFIALINQSIGFFLIEVLFLHQTSQAIRAVRHEANAEDSRKIT